MRAPQEGFDGRLAAAGLTAREHEVFWLVVQRLRNREIAEQLHIAERTVESHVASLLRKLGGDDRTALVALGAELRSQPGPHRSVPRVLSSFVGRAQEVADLTRIVQRNRLVTLTGPAGVGKTRLAYEVALAAEELPPPVLVDLAAGSAVDDVERAFVHALGVLEDDRGARACVREVLREGQHWLLVDNCEHVLDEVSSLLRDWLTTAARLQVLATSRVPLRVAGEVVFEVAPLDVLDATDDRRGVLDTASGRLFADRATTAAPDFEITAANAADVAAICRRLDGLPLALELAAARVRTFAPAELVDHLDDRFALLDGPAARHRTLEAALRWSYDLLDGGGKRLFERCAVFPGEFDFDTATAVLAFPPLGRAEVLRLLPRLVDRSLLSSRRTGERATVYRMLESFRDLAWRQLDERGEAGEVGRHHASFHLDAALGHVDELSGPTQGAATRWFDQHWIDLSEAVRWALGHGGHERVWELVAGVGRRWDTIGLRGEVFGWLDALLAAPLPTGTLGVTARTTASFLLCYRDTGRALELAGQAYDLARSPADRADAELGLGWALAYNGNLDEATVLIERAADGFADLGDRWHQASALEGLGHASRDPDTLQARLLRAADLFGEVGDAVMRANCLTMAAARSLEMRAHLDRVDGWLREARALASRADHTHEQLHADLHTARWLQLRGDHEAAALGFREVLPRLRRLGDQRCVTRCLVGLGWSRVVCGDDAGAAESLWSGVRLARRVGEPREEAAGLRLLADIEERTGDPVRAARWLGAADAAAVDLSPARRAGLPSQDGVRRRLVERLGAEPFAHAFGEGRRGVEVPVHAGRQEPRRPPSDGSVPATPEL